MVLQERSDLTELMSLDIIDPEDRVRVSHIDRRRRMEERPVDRADLQFDGAGIPKFLRKRDFLPGKARPAHIDRRSERLVPLPAVQEAGFGLEGQRGFASLVKQEICDATHAVAAGTRFGAVTVVNAYISVGTGCPRSMERHKLVAAHSVRLRCCARLCGADRAGLPAQVDHYDLVAETVHLDEGAMGERAHLCRIWRVIWGLP